MYLFGYEQHSHFYNFITEKVLVKAGGRGGGGHWC